MPAKKALVCAPILACLLGCWTEAAPPARRDKEQDLVSKIARERRPVRKAKYQIRLARVKLSQAMEALDRNDVKGCQELLQDYMDQMNRAWDTLLSSGRPAHKKPQGFKQLDIALREDSRYLDDLKRRFSYLDREPVEKIQREAQQLRNKVLRALFPALRPKAGQEEATANRDQR